MDVSTMHQVTRSATALQDEKMSRHAASESLQLRRGFRALGLNPHELD